MTVEQQKPRDLLLIGEHVSIWMPAGRITPNLEVDPGAVSVQYSFQKSGTKKPPLANRRG